MMRHTQIKVMICWVVLALLGGLSTARAEVVLWQYQDTQPGTVQEALASTVDSQGNLLITGYTDTVGDDDFYTIKVSSDGQTRLWSARYTHPQGDDWAVAVAVDSEDNVIVAGYIHNGVNLDIGVIKYAGQDGTPLWASPYLLNGAANGNDFATALAVDSMDSIYVVGYTNSGVVSGDDAILFKLGSDGPRGDGLPIWTVTYDGSYHGNDRFNDISIGAGGIAVTGYSTVLHGGRHDHDYLTLKLDALGQTLWTKTFDNGIGDDQSLYVAMDAAGNVLVCGDVAASGQQDMATIKYAAGDGVQSWLRPYSAGTSNTAKGLAVDSDGEVYVIGETFTGNGMDDYYTARYPGAGGGAVWEKVFDSNPGSSNTDIPQALALDTAGGLYVTGRTNAGGTNDFQTLKYNKANGNLIWQEGPAVAGGQQPVGVALALGVAADGNVTVAGWSNPGAGDFDYYAVKYNAGLLNTPTGLNGTAVKVDGQLKVDLVWQDNSTTPNEETFCIERCPGFACNDGFVELTCAIAQDTTSYVDTSVSPDQWYSYRVRGRSAALGYSLPSPAVSVVTTVIDYPEPDWLYLKDVGGRNDRALAIATTSDNNPVATGLSSTDLSQADYYTVKLDRADDTHTFWIAAYDDPDGQMDTGVCLALDNNDDVVVSGNAMVDIGIGENTNAMLTIKYDQDGPDIFSGDPLWAALYSGPVGGYDARSTAVAAVTDASNFMVVTGYGKNPAANYDLYLLKYKPDYDAANQAVWAITPYDGGYDDFPTATAFTPAGDVVVVGRSYNAGGDSDLFLSQYSGTDGSLMAGWPYTNANHPGVDGLNAVVVGEDGSIYVAGYLMNGAGNMDIYVNKFSATGVSQWGGGKVVDGDGHGYDEAKAIVIDPNDGEIVVGATITSVTGSADFHLRRYRADGTLVWQKTLELADHDEMVAAMAMTPSGEIGLAGDTENGLDTDMLAVKYDHRGNLTGSTKVDKGADDSVSAVTANRLGEFFVAGYSAIGAYDDFVVFRLNTQRQLQAPSPFTATAHNTSADLSWVENDPTVSGYKLYRQNGACTAGGTSFGPAELIQTLPQGTVTFNDHPLNINETYCYGIEAYLPGEVARISERQVLTSVPVPPSSVAAYLKNTSEVEVCWHDESSSEDGFIIQRCTGAACADFSLLTDAVPAELDQGAASTCYVDTTACDSGQGKVFRYRVQAYKLSEWASGYDGATDPVTVPDLAASTTLQTRTNGVTEAKVELQWTDLVNVDAADYSVERCQGSGCTDFAEVGLAASSVQGIDLHLQMDEASWTGAPGAVADSSGNGRAATVFGGATTVAGSYGAYFGRSGTVNGSQYLTSPLVIDQSAQSAGVTMMVWAKPGTVDANWRYLLSTEDGTPGQVRNSWGLISYNGTWYVATGEAVRSTGVAVSNGQWQHLAVVFTPGVGIRFYKDGVLSSTLNNPGNIGTHTTSATFTIGRQGVLNQNYFSGQLDEVAVYDRALTTAEVQQLKTVGVFPEASGLKWFTDSGVAANVTYRYQIKAHKPTPCGETYSPPVTAASEVVTAPLAPSGLSGTRVGPGLVALSWTSQTTLHTGFQVERCNSAGCTDFGIITSAVGATTYKFTDRSACYGSDGTNRYQVKALGSWGASTPSTPVSVSSVPVGAAASLTTTPTEASVRFGWSYDPNHSGFIVERCTGTQAACDGGGTFTPLANSPFSGHDAALQGLWRLDEASWNGTVGEVIDSSGQGRNGTARNGAGVDSPGATLVSGYGGYGAASLDGSNDYIDTSLTVDQSTTTAGATFMAWVYQTSQSGVRYVFSTDNGSSGYDWGLFTNGNAWYVDNGLDQRYITTAALNTWQHIALVFDPASGVRFYVNGSQIYTNPTLDYDASTAPFTIGRQGSIAAGYFAGKIDEVRVFNRPLTTAEVGTYRNQTQVPIAITDPDATPGTTYTYKVTPVAGSDCGDWQQTAVANERQVTTLATAAAAPSLTVTTINTTEIDLAWQANTASHSNFIIERCAGSGCDFSALDAGFPVQVGAGATSYADTSVCEGQTYKYRLKAVKGAGEPWDWETPYGVPTPAANTATIANAVAAVNLAVVSESEIDLSWSDSNSDEEGYEVSRCMVVPPVPGPEVACSEDGQFTLLDTFPGTINGALLHYRMDEATWTGAANEVADVSGNGKHGRSYNPTTMATGRFGRAGSFNGSTIYVSTTLPAVSINQGLKSAGVTMEAWVYPIGAADANPRHLLSTDDGGFDWGVVVKNGRWYVNTGVSQWDTGLTVRLNSWQHITAIFTPQSGVTFYKYDTFDSTTLSNATAEIGYDLSTAAFEIGRDAGTTTASYYFNGWLDEVIVYGRPLTPSEVTAHHTYQDFIGTYSYKDMSVVHSSTYHYKVKARKTTAGCGWSKERTNNAATPAPPPPTSFVVVSKNTTSANLSWQDNNGSETGYIVGRCPGASYSCGLDAVEVGRPAGSGTGTLSYADTSLSQGQQYTYRVWATGAWGTTAAVELTLTTDQPSVPTNLTATQVSEVAIDLDWEYTSGDETGVKLERCIGPGTGCSDIELPPNTKAFADNELAPLTEYCYRVRTYKTATNSWATDPTAQVCATTSLTPGSLTATPVDTTTVNLAWGDTAQTETTTIVERCQGDLNACCSGNPASCVGPFDQVGGAGPNQHDFTDLSACAGGAYTYRVNTKGEGLSKANNGCWSKRAPLTFTSFPAFSGVEVVIPYQGEMRADFADLRFYDATAHRELQYWLKQKTDSSSAIVWLMTGPNANIYLYYGNPVALDGSATEAVFTETYDEFAGTTINTQKWVEIDPANKISQNSGLKFANINTTENAALVSTKTFERAAGNELYVDFTVGVDGSSMYELFSLGWEQNQTSAATSSGNGAHLLQLTAANYTVFYMQYVIEDTSSTSFTQALYNDRTRYQVKIVLNGTSGVNHGAKYYIKGGAYANWFLLKETTTHRADDDILRIGFHQAYHDITVHQVTVKHASAQRGASVNFGGAEGDGVSCLSFTHTWVGSPTTADEVLMNAALPPTGLTAGVDNGQVTLVWTAGTGDESAFQVERDCGSGYEQVGTTLGGVTTYSDGVMPASTQCSYQVKGHKATPCPWTSDPCEAVGILAPPAGPEVTATVVNPFQIRLEWSDAGDELGYDVEVQVMNGVWTAVASLSANQVSYTDSHGVNPSTEYTYRVRARRGSDHSAWGEASATTPAYTPGAATCPLP